MGKGPAYSWELSWLANWCWILLEVKLGMGPAYSWEFKIQVR